MTFLTIYLYGILAAFATSILLMVVNYNLTKKLNETEKSTEKTMWTKIITQYVLLFSLSWLFVAAMLIIVLLVIILWAFKDEHHRTLFQYVFDEIHMQTLVKKKLIKEFTAAEKAWWDDYKTRTYKGKHKNGNEELRQMDRNIEDMVRDAMINTKNKD
jgi:ABC-type multidrug transport system fused ATPase/permease subunit